ncbi:MAG: ERCC4 domain-containing protein [Acidobacteriota bacterium]
MRRDLIRIVADDREPEAILASIRTLPGAEVTLARLPVGDFLVGDRLLVERKSLQDFAVSLIDGRLFSQASALANSGRMTLMILEGPPSSLAHSGIRREALQGALITISLIYGIPVLRSLNPEETGRLILYAEKQRRACASGALRRPGYRPKGRRRRQLFLLQGLPGVGPARAKKLLAAFGSVEGVCRADAVSLAEVPGVGRKTADAIRWSVSEALPAYKLIPWRQ